MIGILSGTKQERSQSDLLMGLWPTPGNEMTHVVSDEKCGNSRFLSGKRKTIVPIELDVLSPECSSGKIAQCKDSLKQRGFRSFCGAVFIDQTRLRHRVHGAAPRPIEVVADFEHLRLDHRSCLSKAGIAIIATELLNELLNERELLLLQWMATEHEKNEKHSDTPTQSNRIEHLTGFHRRHRSKTVDINIVATENHAGDIAKHPSLLLGTPIANVDC
jgi:hypothetical protein